MEEFLGASDEEVYAPLASPHGYTLACTVYFGSKELCGDVPNRLDVTDGWNFLMRVYRPGASVLDGTYQLPRPEPLK